MEDRKTPFFKRLKLAVFNLDSYQNFALEKTGVALKYFVKLILLFCVIIGIAMTYRFVNMANQGIDTFRNEMPDFSFENNQLSSKAEEQPTIIEKTAEGISYTLIMDTNIEENSDKLTEYTKKLDLYNAGIILLKDKVFVKVGTMSKIQEYSYESLASQYQIQSLDKQTLLQHIESINTIPFYMALYLTLLLYLFCAYLLATLLETVLLFVLGFFTTKISSVRLKNNQIYNIALYALTLPILLNAIYIPVNILTGFEVKYFQVMYTAISYIYLITAILLIRSDLIKQQIEVQKIEEVQKEVKQEIEEREEKEKKETEDKKEKNEKKEDKNVGTDGQAPEGTA